MSGAIDPANYCTLDGIYLAVVVGNVLCKGSLEEWNFVASASKSSMTDWNFA
jgi:hypothetical protein